MAPHAEFNALDEYNALSSILPSATPKLSSSIRERLIRITNHEDNQNQVKHTVV